MFSKVNADSFYKDLFTASLRIDQPDSIKLDGLIGLIKENRFSNPELARLYADSALSIANKTNSKLREAEIYNQLGIIASVLGDNATALDHFLSVLRVREEIQDLPGIARIQNNLGILYKNLGEYTLSLEFHKSSLETKKGLNDSLGIARSLNNIGEIFQMQMNTLESEKYFQEALEYMIALSYKEGLAAVYNNLGEANKLQGNINRAIEFHSLSLDIEKEFDNKPGIGLSYLNIASLFMLLDQPKTAIKNYEQSISYFKQINDLGGLSKAYNDIAVAYAEIESFKESLLYFRLHSEIKDTLLSIETNQQIAQLQTEYESDKQQKEIQLLNETSAFQIAQLNQEKSTQRLLLIIVILLISIAVILYISNRSNKRINELLVEKNNQIEEAANLKVQFLSVMSHEIRTPMNAVVGMTNLLLSENPREDQKKYLDTLRFSSNNLLSIVNDVLDYSKVEAKKLNLEIIDFRLLQLLSNINQSFYNQAIKKGVYLKFEYDKKIPDVLKGDPIRLTQVLNNLVSNGLKFTDKGSVTVNVSLEEQNSDDVVVNFKVSDTGIGIKPEKIDSIFESFIQASKETHRKYGGTGLGLSISKKLLELYGSQIKVISSVGKGTTFSFSICFPVGNIQEVIKTSKSELNSLKSLKSTRVLLVEDNPVNIQVIKFFLEKWGIEAIVTENGLEAIKKIAEQNFDIILMDLHMPIMDGYEATKRIRDRDKIVPIVALTASNVFEEHELAYECGVNAIVPKPFDPKDLHKVIYEFTGAIRN